MSNAEFNKQSTTDEVIAGIDLSGKVAIVTGASSGLGLETSRVLAGAGAHVVMVARNAEKLSAAVASIRSNQSDAQLSEQLMDLDDLVSVRKAVTELQEKFPTIDILIANAGVMACPYSETTQGLECQFGTNHIGHFLFVCQLVPQLQQSQAARVVILSSAAHRFASMDISDPNYKTRTYDKWNAYGQSKTANALFALELNKRLANSNITAFSVHPGMIMTELGRHLTPEDIKMLMGGGSDSDKSTKPAAAKEEVKSGESKPSPFKSVEQGAATSVWAATSPSLEGKGGIYLEDCQIALPAGESSSRGYAAYIADEQLAADLWMLSENIVDEQFSW